MRKLAFGPYELDDRTYTLSRAGEPVVLSPRPARVLWALVSRAGELVTREEIGAIVWPRGGVELDQVLNTYIRQIRDTLGDNARSPTFIRTHPRRGYQFIEPVREVETTAKEPRMARPPVRRLVGAFALAAVMAFTGGVSSQLIGPPQSAVIAVLPFANLTGDADQAFLVSGLTEEVIAGLAAIQPEHISALSRTSTERFAALTATSGDAGALLGATHVLEGSVRGGSVGLRVTVRLLKVGDDVPIWTEQYDRAPVDILSLRSEMSDRIARSVLGLLQPSAPSVLPAQSDDPGARLALARGQYLLQSGSRDGVSRSIEAFNEALRLDGGIVAAYTGLAYAYARTGHYPGARREVARAIELDPSSPYAYLIRGDLRWAVDWDWMGGIEDIRRAATLAPGSPEIRHSLAIKEAGLGMFDRALKGMETAYRLNPLSAAVNSDYATVYVWAGHFDRALEFCAKMAKVSRKGLEWQAERCAFVAHAAAGNLDEAASAARRWLEVGGMESTELQEIFSGSPSERIDRFLRWRSAENERQIDLPFGPASEVWATLRMEGQEAALEHVSRLVSARTLSVCDLAVDPRLAGLRTRPEFRSAFQPVDHPMIDPPSGTQG